MVNRKAGEMLLTIRVTLTILFSAFVLCSQTIDTGCDSLCAAAKERVKFPSFSAFKSTPEYSAAQFKFQLNLPQTAPSAFDPVKQLAMSFVPQNPSSQTPPARPKAIRYSSGYSMRAKIHKYASIATLPLFVSEAIVGQKLMDRTGEEDSLRSVHSGLAAGIGILFGINSVTGVWNMWETRKDPGHGKRLFHGILMLAADAGFMATAALAPGDDDGEEEGAGNNGRRSASTHRAVAFTSLGVAAFSYVHMLITR